jgi:hypothetical protein
VDFERVIGLVLFGVLHWVLALMLVQDLAERKHVLGGRKALWAVAIMLITFLGSLAYLLCHQAIFTERNER